MGDMRALLNKYRDRLLVRETRKNPLEILQKMVDVQEVSFVQSEHRCYEVIENQKSRPYYAAVEQLSDGNKWVVYCMVDESDELVATNCDLLLKDYKLLTSVTQRDIDENTAHLLDYLSIFEAYEKR
ncbi:hypothetical protein [Atopococcus tabaci]|uniref:hypothetical protein n=1 Tax=Atopococcus tabaci TaxID=269774 RepID=UPI00041BEAED|nr:hypothetical protein [Atopococcus tabaci]